MNKTTKHMLAAAAIASIVGISTTSYAKKAGKGKKAAATENSFKCEGGNMCGGKSACKTATNGCGGKNGCAAQGVSMEKDQAACDAAKAKAQEAKASKGGAEAKSPS